LQIYILEGHHDDDPLTTSNSRSYLFRESPIHQSLMTPPHLTASRQQSWVKPTAAPPLPLTSTYSSSGHSGERHNSTALNGPAIGSFSK
jgi:hypothetical protein